MIGAHSRVTNPSRAHRNTHTPRAAEKMNPSHAQTRTKSVTPMDAGSHAYHTPPQMHTGDTVCHTYCSLIHPLRHSATLAASLAHTPRTRALGPPPQSLGPSNIPPGTRARGPQTLLSSRRSRAIPKLPGFERRWDPSLGSRALAPARSPGHGPRPLSPRRCGCSSRGARLGAPPLAPQPPQPPLPPRPAGRHPGAGAGPRPARQPLQPLAR